eukprot:3723486-Pyramimonas_sp.AAC.1
MAGGATSAQQSGDRLATLGVFWASAFRHAGDRAVATWVVWENTHRSSLPLFPAAGVDLCDLDQVA